MKFLRINVKQLSDVNMKFVLISNRGNSLTLNDLTRYVAKRNDCHFLWKQLVSAFAIYFQSLCNPCLLWTCHDNADHSIISRMGLGKSIIMLWLILVWGCSYDLIFKKVQNVLQIPSEREDTRAVFSISQRNNTLWSANSTLVESTSFIQILESILVIYRYYVFVAVIDCIILRVFKGSSEIWNLLRTLRLNNNLLLIFFLHKTSAIFYKCPQVNLAK